MKISKEEQERLARKATECNNPLKGSDVLDFWRHWPPGDQWNPDFTLEDLSEFVERDRMYHPHEFPEIQWMNNSPAPDGEPVNGRTFVTAEDWIRNWIKTGRPTSDNVEKTTPKKPLQDWASRQETIRNSLHDSVTFASMDKFWRTSPQTRAGVVFWSDCGDKPQVREYGTTRDPSKLTDKEKATVEAFRTRVSPPDDHLLVVLEWDDGALTLVHVVNLVRLNADGHAIFYRDWDIPSGWKAKSLGNDTFTLTRVDGVQFTSYKTGEGTVMEWGWKLVGDLGQIDDRCKGKNLHLKVRDARGFPNPADFLPQFDADHPVEN